MPEPAARASSTTTQPAPARPQVLYVMGAGRSGSTILGVALGNCENLFYAGELDAWLARSGASQLKDEERTRFWNEVRLRVRGADPLYGREPERAIERSLSLLRVNKWRARRRLRTPYRQVAESLYQAITAAAGTMFIVDTSHYPLRARELQELNGIDLYLLYLVRDPRSVVASFNRHDVAQYTKSTLTTNVYLWLTNLLAVLVFLRHPRERRLFVRYEDFVEDPARVLAEILGRAGLTAAPPDFSRLLTGVPFQGNRLIRSEVIALESGPPKRAGRSALTTVLQLPWAFVLARLKPSTSSPTGGARAVRE
ncbi:MAG TPA: sulfotransferase [Solirubrobacteraceae bacterium]|nr:sulfotransferase [Solirubrobacteraceae bacterium]